MSQTVRVMIVDDHPVVRKGLRAFLETQPGMEVVGEAADGKEAMRELATGEPDLILLDLHLPDASGSELIPEMRKWNPDVKVLVLT
ncbi:MAG: Response regulator receiver protein, partial [Acidimicrobiia bacterium]|nr:Response regulator receiver protein [Acidimicrobiia bacterium]